MARAFASRSPRSRGPSSRGPRNAARLSGSQDHKVLPPPRFANCIGSTPRARLRPRRRTITSREQSHMYVKVRKAQGVPDTTGYAQGLRWRGRRVAPKVWGFLLLAGGVGLAVVPEARAEVDGAVCHSDLGACRVINVPDDSVVEFDCGCHDGSAAQGEFEEDPGGLAFACVTALTLCGMRPRRSRRRQRPPRRPWRTSRTPKSSSPRAATSGAKPDSASRGCSCRCSPVGVTSEPLSVRPH